MDTLFCLLLVLQLGSPDYRCRVTSQYHLTELLPHSAPALTWGLAHKDPEIATRCLTVLKGHWHNKAKALRPRIWDRTPWVDSLPKDYPQRSDTIVAYLAEVGVEGAGWHGGGGTPDWPKYRLATVLLLEDLCAAGWGDERLLDLLDDMAVYEENWCRGHKTQWNGIKVPVLKERP
jgi:hypothetical protein